MVWSGYLPPKHVTVFLLGKILIRFNNAKKFFYLILLTLPVVFLYINMWTLEEEKKASLNSLFFLSFVFVWMVASGQAAAFYH